MKAPSPFNYLEIGDLVTVAIAPGSRLLRIHFAGQSPDGSSRFSDPLNPPTRPRRFRPIYMAGDFFTVFGEVVVRDRRDYHRDDLVSRDELIGRKVSTIQTTDTLTLLSLHDEAPTRMGIPTDAVRWRKTAQGRKLSELVWLKFPNLHGISYPSRITERPCRMVYDRNAGRLKVIDTVPLMGHPLLGLALDHYRLALR